MPGVLKQNALYTGYPLSCELAGLDQRLIAPAQTIEPQCVHIPQSDRRKDVEQIGRQVILLTAGTGLKPAATGDHNIDRSVMQQADLPA